jgi:hypothetical protein
VAALPGGWLVVHFINRKNAPFLLFHTNGDTTVAIGVALVFASGCAQQDWIDRTLVTVDVTGTWQDQGWEIRLLQEGSTVKGSIGRSQILDPNYSGPLEGTVGGDMFSFRQTNGPVTGEMKVSEDEMSGTVNWRNNVLTTLRRVNPPPSQASPPR